MDSDSDRFWYNCLESEMRSLLERPVTVSGISVYGIVGYAFFDMWHEKDAQKYREPWALEIEQNGTIWNDLICFNVFIACLSSWGQLGFFLEPSNSANDRFAMVSH